MSISKVKVIHAFISAHDGQWKQRGSEETIPTDEARMLESQGYVDILETDGKPEVWAPCCLDH